MSIPNTLAFHTGDDDEESSEHEGDEIREVIKMPEPSKWEIEGYDSDIKQAAPAAKQIKEAPKALSR